VTAGEIGVLLMRPASMSRRPRHGTGGEDPGQRGARQDRLDGGAGGQQRVGSAEHIGRHDVQADASVLETIDLQVAFEQRSHRHCAQAGSTAEHEGGRHVAEDPARDLSTQA
jgi:hypothetical protein